MKEIRAYVHRSRVAAVLAVVKALPQAQGQRHVTLALVKGTLVPLDEAERHYSLDAADEVVNEYKIELYCEDAQVEDLIHAIRAAAHTGRAEGGLIAVAAVERVDWVN